MNQRMRWCLRPGACWLGSVLIVGLALAGCQSAVAPSRKQSTHQTRRGSAGDSGTNTASVSDATDASSPISQMTVQGERVEAADLWKEHRDELDAKHNALSSSQFRQYVAERSAQLITDKIAEVLLFQRASLRMPEGLDKRIEDYTDAEVRKTVTADYEGVQRRYEKELEEQGRTLDEVREQMRRQVIISSYLDAEIRPRVAEPTREQLYDAFQTNIESWRKPARRSMSLIDVRVSEFLPKGSTAPTREESEAARNEARRRIGVAQSEIRSGASFAEVARKYSQGLHAEEGGAWGFVTADSVRERFVPALIALDTLDAGEISSTVETPDGFFLVRCDELQPAIEPDFQTVQLELREEFIRNRYNRQIAELVFELRNSAHIEPENLERFHAAVVMAAFQIAEPIHSAPR